MRVRSGAGVVLVVDDDRDARARLRSMLGKDGWTVTEAHNGVAAIAQTPMLHDSVRPFEETISVTGTGHATVTPDRFSFTTGVRTTAPTVEDAVNQNNSRTATGAAKLPNETGGVLLGAVDVSRRVVYVVDMIPSPPDSEEWPSSYRRGSEGLQHQLAEISERTLENLEYVGEWHSHPDKCGIEPSLLGQRALSEISAVMGKASLPGLMLIVGENREYDFHLATAPPELMESL